MIRLNDVIQAVRQFAPVRRVNGAQGDIVIPSYVPEPSGNSLVYGNVVATGNLGVRVSKAQYVIQGATYSSAQTDLTIGAADATNPRIDVIALTSAGTAVVVAGTAAASPAKPVVDPTTQLEISTVYVPATATSLSFSNRSLYLENTEWTSASSGTGWTLASTNNPLQGTKDIEATAVAAGSYITLTDTADNDLANYNSLILNLRSKAAWSNQKSLLIEWLDSTGARVGAAFTLKDGVYGFDSSITAAYQQIVIPAVLFQANGRGVRKLKVTVQGGGSAVGFYLDYVFLQGGLTLTKETTQTISWQGTYSSTKAYAANDTVTYNETVYVSLVNNNLGNTPSPSSTVWQMLKRTIETWAFACSDFNSTALAANTNVGGMHAPYAARVLEVYAGLQTAQASGATLTVDVNEAGVSIISTKLTFANTFDHTSLGGATQPVISDALIAKGAKITADIDQIGNGSAKGLVVYLLVMKQ